MPIHQRWRKLERRLDVELDELTLLRENRTTWIYRGLYRGDPVVVKQYKRHARALCEREAQAVAIYENLCENDTELLPARLIALNRSDGAICLSFIEGELMSDVLRSRDSSRRLGQCVAAVRTLGTFLTTLRTTTATSRRPSDFFEEYLSYVSEKLENLPILGRTVFRGYSTDVTELFEGWAQSSEPTSLTHGDLVFANMVVNGSRIGLIDFANSHDTGHTLDDVYNFEVTCRSLLHLREAVRQDFVESLRDGIGATDFDPRIHAFFSEYHRRRWMMLQLGGGPFARARALTLLPRMVSSSSRARDGNGPRVSVRVVESSHGARAARHDSRRH